MSERAQVHRRRSNESGRGPAALKDIEERKLNLASLAADCTAEETAQEQSEQSGWREHLKIVLPHVILVVGTVLYMLLGAAIFYWIERPYEKHIKTTSASALRDLQQTFLEETWNRAESQEEEWMAKTEAELDLLIEKTFRAFVHGVTAEQIEDNDKMKLEWTFLSSILFTTTVITTVGYGHVVPVTFWGRIFCVTYALFGIPLALITIADLGKFASIVIVMLYKRFVRCKEAVLGLRFYVRKPADLGEANNNLIRTENLEKNRLLDNDQPTALASSGSVSGLFVLTILLGYAALSATAFMFWEGWSFYDSFYFFFITMVTVGFGDIVPTKEAYHMLAVFFIFMGLVLTTMSIDLVGTGYIERIHYFGRRLQLAKEALALLGGKAVNMQEWLTQQKATGNNDNLRLMIMPNNYVNLLRSDRWFAFVPKDAPLMHYIDQMGSTSEDNVSSVNCIDFHPSPMRFLVSALLSWIRPRCDDDFVDRLNYYYTTLVLLVAAIGVSSKQYMGKPLQCYVPTQFNSYMEEYIEAYCWIQNTYYVPMYEHIPDDLSSRTERQIGYYQWVPLILFLQALMFIFPCLLWRVLSWQTGMNLHALVSSADLSHLDGADRQKAIRTIARALQDVIDLHCGVHFGKKGAFYWINWYRYNGGFMTLIYIFIKIVYTLNIVLQFFLLNAFLKSDAYSVYGFQVLSDLLNGREWSETGHFPRVTLCDFEVRFVGNINRYTVQCALMINLFNEKVFTFIWCWFILLAVVTICSCIFWVFNSCLSFQRVGFVVKFLHMSALSQQMNNTQGRSIYAAPMYHYEKFVNQHLRTDGVFMLRMISNHVGDFVTIEVIKSLWREFRIRSANDFDSSSESSQKQTIITREGTSVVLRHSCPPIQEDSFDETPISFNNNASNFFASKSISQP